MDQPNWNDLHTAEEWADRLDDLAGILARHLGNLTIGGREKKVSGYAFAGELQKAAECIRDLQEQVETLRKAGGSLVRQVMAAKESLTSKPQ